MNVHMKTTDQSEFLVDLAGELHGALVAKITAYIRADQPTREQIRADALNRFTAAGLITPAEKQQLASLTDTVIARDKPPHDSIGAVQTFASAQRNASPIVKVMVKIAEDSLRTPGITFGAVAHADVDGALVGGILAFELTKGAGTIAGMVAGAAAASIAQAL